MSVTSSRIILAATAVLWVHAAAAQLTSDVVARERPLPKGEEIRRDLEDARLHLGPFRVQPQFFLRDFGYTNNVYGTSETDARSDVTASVAGGARFTLPVGPKMYLRGSALPQYTWYSRTVARRTSGGLYDSSVVALFNHLSLEAKGSLDRTVGIVNSELESPAVRQTNHLELNGEVDIFRRLSAYGTVAREQPQFRTEAGTANAAFDQLAQLDRHDSDALAGLRYRWKSYLAFTLAAEQTRSRFTIDPIARNNKSRAVQFGVRYDRPKGYANILVSTRRGTPLDGGSFLPYKHTTGSYFLSYSLTAPIELQLSGRQQIAYGVFAVTPYYLERRNGLTLIGRLGNRIAVHALGETGSNDYAAAIGISPAQQRKDGVVTWGGGFTFRLFRSSQLLVDVSRTNYDSNVDSFNRSFYRIQTALSLAGALRR